MPKNHAKKRQRLEAELAEDQRREAAEAQVFSLSFVVPNLQKYGFQNIPRIYHKQIYHYRRVPIMQEC